MSRPLLLIASLFLILVLVPVSAGAARKPDGWYDATLAAWVQAIGSILAIAGAAAIGLWQAEEQRQRDKEALRQRALDAAEARIQVLFTAIKVCEWSRSRLTKIAAFVEGNPPRASVRFLPMVMPEFPVFQARLAGLSLEGLHMILRENIIGAEGFITAVHGGMAKAVLDIGKAGSDPVAVRAQLLKDLAQAAKDLEDITSNLKNGVGHLRQQASALEP